MELEIGFAVEALFGLLLNMVVLYSMETQHKRVAFWTPIVATIMLVGAMGNIYLCAHAASNAALQATLSYSGMHHCDGHVVCAAWTC